MMNDELGMMNEDSLTITSEYFGIWNLSADRQVYLFGILYSIDGKRRVKE